MLKTGILSKQHVSTESRARFLVWLLASGTFLIFLFNSVYPLINIEGETFSLPTFEPFIKPVGTDFREGLYYPAKVLLQGKNPYIEYNSIYPPFAVVFAIPFRLFSVGNAYLLEIALLFVSNLASLYFALLAVRQTDQNESQQEAGSSISRELFFSIAILSLTSYGFFFSIERGNFDIFTQVFSILGLITIIKRPKWLWMQVLLFSIAAHLKIYPAVFLILILWEHGWKSIFPIAVVNLGLLFISGPANALSFIQVIIHYSQNPYIWVGNHSAASFASFFNNSLNRRVGWTVPEIIFYLLPLLLWITGIIYLWMRPRNALNAVFMFVLSAPIMNLIPSVSHDYKLVLISAPIIMILYLCGREYTNQGGIIPVAGIVLLLGLMFFLTRSYIGLPSPLANKYPFLLILEGIFLLATLKLNKVGHFTKPSAI